MLASLHIENIAVIKNLDTDFSDGFTVLTGETGAGKSILIDSIAFLLGGKAQRELIRTGEEKALVSGFFTDISPETRLSLAEHDIYPDEDGSLTIQKTLTIDGKVNVKINGRTVSSTVGRLCGMSLINIHGQHENQVLQNTAQHIRYLDRFSENDTLLKEYGDEYAIYTKILSDIKRLTENEREKERRRELLTYQINDIESQALEVGEEEALLARKHLLNNAKVLQKYIVSIYRALYKNPKSTTASQLMETAQDSLDKLSSLLPEVGMYSEKLGTLQAEVEEIAKAVASLLPDQSDNPEAELEEINERLDIIRKLKRKYGSNIEEILTFLDKAKQDLNEIEHLDGTIAALEKTKQEKETILRKLADQLHVNRVKYAERLSAEIQNVLSYLDMSKVSFSVRIENKNENATLSSDGYDRVEFFIATNPGEPMKPLTKIASGGELSRIMLAIKCVLADAESVPSIIFDEVDTGVSGKTSQKIGFKLHDLSQSTQVICITHAAQIAAVADHHYLISKTEQNGRMQTSLTLLNTEGRVNEIARIIGGVNITDTIRKTARELLETSKHNS